MNSPQFPTDSLNIPQAILDRYNARYSNATYRAFSDTLAASLPGGVSHPDHLVIMNLLIDSALERCDAELYHGAAVRLGAALMPYANPELFALAEQPLRQFNQDADETVLTAGLLHSLEIIRHSAESAVHAASDHHDWRGLVAFWWLSAIASLAQAAHAVLNESHDGFPMKAPLSLGVNSYVQEKLTAAVLYERNGINEGAVAGLILSHPVMNWFNRFSIR